MQHHATHRNAAPHMRAASFHHPMPQPGALPTNAQAPLPPPPQQQQQQTQHMRERSNTRLNNHHTQSLHTLSNQMQKIRQQHQHLSNNPKCVQQPQQQQQQQQQQQSYNNHTQHHNVPYPQMAPHQQPHTQPHPHMLPPHINSYQQQSLHAPIHKTQPPQHYYVSNNVNKPKYNMNHSNNNNNNNNNSQYNVNNNHISSSYAPKTILQNTNRSVKINSSTPLVSEPKVNSVTAAAVEPTTTNSNNIIITPEVLPVDTNTTPNDTTVAQDVPKAEETKPSAMDNNTENSTQETEQQHVVGATLANEDNTVPRNSKDKTPMCLVNELARYNKITHQYRLTGERGPAHSKTFTVTLRLGEEEYSADGFKIKKAQHIAAGKAIEQTKYKHPPPKTRRSEEGSNSRMHITPTVELNALAMKLGQRTYYLLDPTQLTTTDAMMAADFGPQTTYIMPPHPAAPHAAAYLRRNGNYVTGPPPQMPPQTQQRYNVHRGYPPKYPGRFPMAPHMGGHLVQPQGPYAPIPSTPSKITLFVGKQKFVGIGRTLQQAKHDAAARALQVLKSQGTNASEESLDDSIEDGDKKSPISQVHEIGIKRDMTVHFKVLREEGPAHMKNFITACIVGSIITEGDGNGKKISKKRAADKMLIELQKLPPLTPTKQTPMKRIKVKTPGKITAGATPNGKPERRKRLAAGSAAAAIAGGVKEKPVDLDDEENPITKLIQLTQNRKEKEPVFELIAKNGNENSRRREFIIEVSAGGMIARGTGNSKKLAKRSAAQTLLNHIMKETEENTTESAQTTNEISTAAAETSNGKVTEVIATTMEVPMVTTPAGPVPGILIIRQNKKHAAKKKEAAGTKTATTEITQAKQDESKADAGNNNKTTTTTTQSETNSTSTSEANNTTSNTTTTTTGATTSTSNVETNANTNSNGTTSNSGGSSNAANLHMKEQLLYLAKLLGFEVNFSDYPKGNHNEFLTIVTLSTDPPQICHGVGSNSEESQNDAAKNALKILSELGLNNAKK